MAAQTFAAAEPVLRIPLANIQLSKTNPRKVVDPKALADLASDIKHRGIQEPILVRPLHGSSDKFELVFGERRYLASEKARQETVPSIVRELSDDEAFQIQVTENLQRENLHPLEEADAFARLYEKAVQEKNGHDAALKLVAGQIGKKPDLVAQRMKLRDLIEPAKAAFLKAKILLGHAFELARLREDEQEKALAWMLERGKDIQTPNGWKRLRIMPGVPELRLWIQEHLFLDLTRAPFDTADATLNPAMGSCLNCQFRTGNQPVLFKDISQESTCTAPGCWTTKRDATLVNLAAATAKELGVEAVLKVGFGYPGGNTSKVPVDAYIDHGTGARIAKKGSECAHTKPGVVTWIRFASDAPGHKVGDRVDVCTKANECTVHNKVDSRSERPRKSFEAMADTRIANLRESCPQRVRSALIRAIIESAMKERQKLSPSDKVRFDLMAKQMHCDLYFDRHRDVCKLMDVEPAVDKPGQSKDWRGASSLMFDGNPVAMMVAMTLMHRYHVGSFGRPDPDPLKPLLSIYKIDANGITKRTKADVDLKIAEIRTSLKKRKARTA